MGRCFKQQIFISHILETGKYEIKVLADVFSQEILLSGLHMAIFFALSPHDRERQLWYLFLFLLRALIPTWEGPPSWPRSSSKPDHVLKAPPPDSVTLEVRASPYEFWGCKNAQSTIDTQQFCDWVPWNRGESDAYTIGGSVFCTYVT